MQTFGRRSGEESRRDIRARNRYNFRIENHEPTEANTSQLMPEMLFHATWATWDAATRATYCSDVKRRGFDAAETIGMAMSLTWQGQIRAAGSSWYLDDYDLVLDVLDTCEEY